MTLIIENVKDEFLPAFKGLAKSINAKCKIENIKTKKNEKTSLQKALNELENGEYESFKNFEEYKKAMCSNV